MLEFPSSVPLEASATFVGGEPVRIASVPELSNAAIALAAAFLAAVIILKLLAMFMSYLNCIYNPFLI